jgi:hypothetical protein
MDSEKLKYGITSDTQEPTPQGSGGTQKGIEIYKYPSDIDSETSKMRQVHFIAITGETTMEQADEIKKLVESDDATKSLANTTGMFGNGMTPSDSIFDNAWGFVNSLRGAEASCFITLPLPGSLSDSQSHSWQQESVTQSVLQMTNDIAPSFAGQNEERAGAIKNWVDKTEGFMKTAGRMSAFAAQLTRSRQVMANPGFFQVYQNTGLRSFSFAFSFVPESKKEKDQIINIIKAFKKYSAPSTDAGGTALLSPFVWFISISNGVINELMSLRDCVCTSVQVTYGTDKFDVFEDGMPKKIKLELNFSECSVQYANNYDNHFDEAHNGVAKKAWETMKDYAGEVVQSVKDLPDNYEYTRQKINEGAVATASKLIK